MDKNFFCSTMVTFSLLGLELKAAVSFEKGNWHFIVSPTALTTEKFPLNDLVSEINRFFHSFNLDKNTADKNTADEISLDSITDELNSSVSQKIKWPTVLVSLEKIFLSVTYENGKINLEYAFEIALNLDGNLPEKISFVDVHKVSFGFWNTPKKQIIKEMGLGSFLSNSSTKIGFI